MAYSSSMSPAIPPVLLTPAEAAAWRRARPAGPRSVTVVTGTFEILQPGNLAALLRAAALGGDLVTIVEDDGASPSQAARGTPVYTLSDRMACLCFLKKIAAVCPGRPADIAPLLQALAPYTWLGRPLPGDGAIPKTAARLAAGIDELPLLPDCRTGDIAAAAREGRVPIALPPAFPSPDPAAGPVTPPAATVNGCFDVLHIGHFRFLARAAALAGAPLCLLINSDASIRRYKGPGRPVFPQAFRRAALLALRAVADAQPFDEDEPLARLANLKPPLHIKGGSREPGRVRREEELLAQWGGRVAFCPLEEGYSTSAYLARVAKGAAGP